MSKSLGNAIAPQDIIKESGAEILRLWVAMVDYREEMRVGKQILARVVEAYRKIRNTLRYLVVEPLRLRSGGRSGPARADARGRSVRARRATRRRPPTCCGPTTSTTFPTIFQAVNQFATVDLSAFYADVSKDRLYTFAADSPERRSAQTAMYIIADGLTRLLAPILPVTADELWRHLPGHREESVHLAEFPRDAEDADRSGALERWERLMRIRDDVNRALEAERQAQDHRHLARRAGAARAPAAATPRSSSATATICRCCSSCRRWTSKPRPATGAGRRDRRRAGRRRQVPPLLAHRAARFPRPPGPKASATAASDALSRRRAASRDDRLMTSPTETTGVADTRRARGPSRPRARRRPATPDPLEVGTMAAVVIARSAHEGHRPAHAAARARATASSRTSSTSRTCRTRAPRSGC